MFTIKQGDDTMSDERQIYTEYRIIGGNGFVDGIRDDAPEEAKREFEKFLRKQKELKKDEQ